MELLKRAGSSDIDGVKTLIQQGVDIDTMNCCKETALYLACENGHTEVVKYLMDNGASVNLGDDKPLIAAVKYNHYDCVRLLLEYHADANCTNTEQESPMSVALQEHSDDIKLILLLLQYDAILSASLGDDMSIKLLRNATEEHAKVMQKLIDENFINVTSNNTFLAAFDFAFKNGSSEMAERMLLNDGYSAVEQRYPNAAYYGAKNNWPNVLLKLLEERFDVNAATEGQTPLYIACNEEHEYVVYLLLSHGANPNAPNKDTDGSVPLEIALCRENMVIVYMLLEKGAKLNQPGQPLLHVACSHDTGPKSGDGETKDMERMLSIIRVLLEHGVNVNAISDKGDTALYRACESQQLEVVQILLEAGADVNLTSQSHYPLIKACEVRNVELINLLVNAGADVTCSNSNNETCLHVLAYIPYKTSDTSERLNTAGEAGETLSVEHMLSIIRQLLQRGVNVNAISNEGDTALYRACQSQQFAVVQVLLEAGADVNLTSNRLHPLMAACEAGNIELINLLVNTGADMTCSTIFNKTCLHAIANPSCFPSGVDNRKAVGEAEETRSSEDVLSVIGLLLQHGVNVNAISDEGYTALYRACVSQQLEVVQVLLEAGADVSLTSNKFYPLMSACDAGNVELIKLLLKSGADVQCRTINNKTCLHAVANSSYRLREADNWKTADKTGETRSVEDMLSVIGLLLQQGVDVNAIADKGDTALYRACERQQLEVVHMLLEAGADVSLTSKSHYPLVAACDAGNVKLVNLLVNAGADVKCTTSGDETCLHAVVNAYSSFVGSQMHVSHSDIGFYFDSLSGASVSVVNIIESLIEAGVDVNACCSRGESALYRASKAGHEHIVRLLLSSGAEANGSRRRRPLYAACEQGHTQIVDLLLNHGADPNDASECQQSADIRPLLSSPLRILPTVARSGYLPIHCAVQKGYTIIVHLLIKYGADVNKQDRSGKSALTYCIDLLDARIRNALSASNPVEGRDLNILRSLMLGGADVLSEYRGFTILHVASYFGLCDVMTTLIQRGADCNRLTSTGKSALDLACENGHEAAVELLLKNGANVDRKTVTSSRNVSGESIVPVLCTAAKHGNATIVKMLLKHGISVNEADNQGNTALHLTTSAEVIETLLNAGANVNAKNNDGQTALCVVCTQQQADACVVQMLLKFGADPNLTFPLRTDFTAESVDVQHSPLSCACITGNKAVVESLLMNGASATFVNAFGITPLHFAINRLCVRERANSDECDPIVALLLKHNAPVNIVSSMTGKTLLYAACADGLASVVKQLLACKADVCQTTSNGKYPLMIACKRKFTDIAMMLLDRGADVNVSDYDQTPLKLASANGDVVLVKRLLDCGANVNEMGYISETALHVAVERGRGLRNEAFANIVHLLLKNGAEPNAYNHVCETPLCFACRPTDVNVGIVKILLDHGADPNICIPYFQPPYFQPFNICPRTTWTSWLHDCVLSPLSLAAICGNSELATLLLKYGARVDDRDDCGRTALHFAVDYDDIRRLGLERKESVNRHISTAEVLLSAGADVNALDTDGASPLYLACQRGETEISNFLLENKADVNTIHSSGETPLYIAVSRQLLDVVNKMLEECGGNPNKGSLDKSSLIKACLMQNVELVHMLLKHGADPNLTSMSCNPDFKRKIPLFLAIGESNIGITKFLVKAGADVNAVNEKGENVACFAAEKMITSRYYKSAEETRNELSVIRLLLEHGAKFNVLMPNGRSPLNLAVTALAEERDRTVIELLQLMVKHGAELQDSTSLTPMQRIVRRRAHNSGTIRALATFAGKHEFILDLFQAGAGFQLIAFCCNKMTSRRTAKSISLCKAAVLAGYVPNTGELLNLRLAAARDSSAGHQIQQLVNWLNEDRKQVPSLLRQCRVVIRRQLSVAVHFQSILPAIDKLPLPLMAKQYLQFDGPFTEVVLGVKKA